MPQFFKTSSGLRKWFEKNHDKKNEIFIGFYKKGTGKPGVTYPESVDQALCFGWIDGIGRSINEESYCVRFTPRRPKSNWSAVNIKKVEELKKLGLMTPAGLAAFEKFDVKNSKIYSYENETIQLDEDYEKQFKKNKKAWDNFLIMAPSYRKITIRWVMSAKQDGTKVKRLQRLISDSKANNKIKEMSYGKNKGNS
ncbi:MAG: YdeI/OmpD-associated family protein [bacterium]